MYEEKELNEVDTMRKIGISDFSTKPPNFYNLRRQELFKSTTSTTCFNNLRGNQLPAALKGNNL
jgi:hypothetical protein